MAENKLPSGVGKKIVEALKKQAEIEIQPVPDNRQNSVIQESVQQNSNNVITDNVTLSDNFADFSLEDDIQQTTDDILDNNLDIELDNANQNDFGESFSQNLNFEETEPRMFEEKEMFATTRPAGLNNIPQQKNYTVPANVAVLKRLIMQLPQGVTKQTGAQIIRQTMEALGISMNSVLKEAQQGQDSLSASAKACMTQIAEYKNNIKSLEKQVQDYKRQAVALNDLISLFVLTDKQH